MIKPLLSEKTLSKFNLLGQDPDVWKPALLAEIPAELLPVSYGGTLTDPLDGNPDCSSLVIYTLFMVFKILTDLRISGEHGGFSSKLLLFEKQTDQID